MLLRKNLKSGQLLQNQRRRINLPCSGGALLCIASIAVAQVPAGQPAIPDVIVLQKKWREEYRNAALEEDQFQVLRDREQEERARKDADRQNEIKRQQGMPTSAPPNPKFSTRERGISVAYLYEVKFKNTGANDIRTLTWDYVLFDPATKREVGCHRFVSKVRIGPGKTKTVEERSSSPPTGSIDAGKAGKKLQDQYSEQVIIQSIGYADGSVWKAASNDEK